MTFLQSTFKETIQINSLNPIREEEGEEQEEILVELIHAGNVIIQQL